MTNTIQLNINSGLVRIREADGNINGMVLYQEGGTEDLIKSLLKAKYGPDQEYFDKLLDQNIIKFTAPIKESEGKEVTFVAMKIRYKWLRSCPCGWMPDWAEASGNQCCDIYDVTVKILYRRDDGEYGCWETAGEIGYVYSDHSVQDFADLEQYAADGKTISIVADNF